MRPFHFLLWATGLCLAACSGKAVIDGPNGSGGEAGSTTTTTTHTITTTTHTTGNGGASACPDPFPAVGAPCTTEGATCPLELSCCGAHALCQGGSWQFGGPFCAEDCPTPCGPSGLGCVLNALCVLDLDWTSTYHCAANPCGGAPNCECAGSVCQPSYFTCASVSGNTVTCDCPNC